MKNHSDKLLTELRYLRMHEWAAVATVIGMIAMLAVSSYMLSPPLSVQLGAPHRLVDNAVEVFVVGGVEHPGPRRVARGTTVEDVLAEAKPLPEANLRRINGQSKVRANQVIKVPVRKAKAGSRAPVKNPPPLEASMSF